MFSKTKMGISLHFINPTLSEIEGCLLHFRFSLYEKVLDVFYRFLRSDRFWFLGFIKHSNIVLKGIRLSNLYFWEFTPMTFTSKVTFSWNSSNFGKTKTVPLFMHVNNEHVKLCQSPNVEIWIKSIWSSWNRARTWVRCPVQRMHIILNKLIYKYIYKYLNVLWYTVLRSHQFISVI